METEYITASTSVLDVLHYTTQAGLPATVGIGYEAGVPTDREAVIVTDPADGSNKILKYWLKNATITNGAGFKGRIQTEFPVDRSILYWTYQMRLHADIEHYRDYSPENLWFTVSEMFIGDPLGGGGTYPFRIGLHIAKPVGTASPLIFLLVGENGDGTGNWSTVWAESNTDFLISTDVTMHMAIGYKRGDGVSGRFRISVTLPGMAGVATTLFDITNWTYNSNSPVPVNLSNWQPLKLYTSDDVIDHIRDAGGVTQMYYDDLQAYDNW